MKKQTYIAPAIDVVDIDSVSDLMSLITSSDAADSTKPVLGKQHDMSSDIWGSSDTDSEDTDE